MSASRITLMPTGAGRAPAALLLGISLLHPGALFATDAAPREAGDWWRKPRRMIQTNLREIDARMDLDAYVATLQDFGANVVLFNVGGIVANYPADLPFHYRNPMMTGDFTGAVVRRLHAAGIRVIGRFDFSKVNERIARDHPEWLSRDTQGNAFPPYNGQVPTCLNGGYQQEGMFQILGEALERYPLDGVFFNMIGYPRSDYSGRNLGVCQCQGCRTRFRESSQLELPTREAPGEAAYQPYQEFCQRTVRDQFERVNRLIKGRKPNTAICTYTTTGVDVIRMESNRPHHQWTWEDSERARFVRLNDPDHQLANAAVHFIDYPQRHAAVSPWLTQRRLLQHLVNGPWLDFYCIGPLHILEDRLGLDQVRDIYRFHQANERWLLVTGSAPVALPCLGIERPGHLRPATPGTYLRLRPEDKARLAQPILTNLDLVFLDGELRAPETAPDAERWLRFIPAAMFGPPEKCYYTNVSEIPALYRRAFGKDTVVWFPWSVGAHYDRQGHLGHAALVEGALTRLLELPRRLRVEASPLVEANHRIARDGTFEWISLLNLSGQVDKGLHAPLPQRDLPLWVTSPHKVSSVRLLQANREVPFQQADDGQLRCIVPRLEAWEIILLH